METGAGNLCGGLRVKNVKVCADIPMGFRLKIEFCRLAEAADFHVFAVVLTERCGRGGDIREFINQTFLFGFKLGKLVVVLLDGGFDGVHLCHNGADIAALLLDFRNLLAGGVLLCLECLFFCAQFPSFAVDCDNLVNCGVHIFISCFHCGLDKVGIFSYQFNVKHLSLLLFITFQIFS